MGIYVNLFEITLNKVIEGKLTIISKHIYFF